MKNKKQQVVIIGAGIGGIATAIRLRLKGFEVDVFEKNSFAGGKLAEIRSNGFRFDAGPSLFTLPNLVDELFNLAGKNPDDFFRYSKLDIICKYHYEDGTVINAFQDVQKFAKELVQKTSVQEHRVHNFLEHSKLLYNLTSDVFIFNSFHRLKTFYSSKFLRALLQFYKLKATTTMHKDICTYFSDNRVIQLFDRYATYNGSNPYTAPGTLNVIPHLEHNIGAYFPEEGMYSITGSLIKLAKETGVRFHFNQRVVEVTTDKRNVRKVLIEHGHEHDADIVVSDIDIVSFYDILKGYKIKRRYLKEEKSTSALIFYWGVRNRFPELELHNILFSRNYKEEFDHLFKYKSVYEDPTIYIFISSKKVAGDAPQGSENWFVMINTPENIGQDWDTIIDQTRKKIQSKINRMLQINIQDHIVTEDIIDPRLIESRTSSFHGSLYGSSSNSKFSAFTRHSNVSGMIKGLYFVGGSVHPGGGIPLCLASAKIVDDLISSRYPSGDQI